MGVPEGFVTLPVLVAFWVDDDPTKGRAFDGVSHASKHHMNLMPALKATAAATNQIK